MSDCRSMTLAELRRQPAYRALPRRLGKSKFGREQLCAYLEAQGVTMQRKPGLHWFIKGTTRNFAACLQSVVRVFEPVSPIGSRQYWSEVAKDADVTHILVFGVADDPESWRGFAILQDRYGCEHGKCGMQADAFYLKLLLVADKGAVSGRMLMDEIHGMARRMKRRRVVCFALPAALGFYVKLGYRVSDEGDCKSSIAIEEPKEIVPDVFVDARYMKFFTAAQKLGYGTLLPSIDKRTKKPKLCRSVKDCVNDGIYMSLCL